MAESGAGGTGGVAGGKSRFDDIYDRPDPRAYFQRLAPLEYEIPHHAQPVFRQVATDRTGARRRTPRQAGHAGRVLLVRDQRRAAQPRRHAGGDVRAVQPPCLPDDVDGRARRRGQGVLCRATPTGRSTCLRPGHRCTRRAVRGRGGTAGHRLHRRPGTELTQSRSEARARRGRSHHPDRRRQLYHRPHIHCTAVQCRKSELLVSSAASFCGPCRTTRSSGHWPRTV